MEGERERERERERASIQVNRVSLGSENFGVGGGRRGSSSEEPIIHICIYIYIYTV